MLSEGPRLGSCPVYDMTLHPNGAYILNGERFVKDAGVTEGKLTPDTWKNAEKLLSDASFGRSGPSR